MMQVVHVAVDRRAVVQFAHHAVDQVLLDQVILAAADDAGVGRVVDLVAIDVHLLLPPSMVAAALG